MLGIATDISTRGAPVWPMRKTMDNDVPGADDCSGF